mmetsp:Transcript_3976/g.11921  ORF Transcript_3976/g.11921 Transcript_3976/m.11921 type:complete len:139 (+) Transcript_3976:288-704(+)
MSDLGGSGLRRDLQLLRLTNWEDMNVLPNCRVCCVAGMDTKKPLLTVDGAIFEGQHRPVVGTHLYFHLVDGEPRLYGVGTKKTVFHRVVAVPAEVAHERGKQSKSTKVGLKQSRHIDCDESDEAYDAPALRKTSAKRM